MFIEPPCKAEKESNEDKDRKGCAVLVKGRDIGNWDGFGFRQGLCDGVRLDCLAVAPSCVPLMHQQGIDPARCGSRRGFIHNRRTIMEIDAVAVEMGG